MDRLTPASPNAAICSICGRTKEVGEIWFLITENAWEDRLKVWKWNRQMATAAVTHSLCSPWHVRELVVHWMTTGCLHYPFASSPGTVSNEGPQLYHVHKMNEADSAGTSQLAEIAVDREGIVRVLRENPLSLNTILAELIIVLEKQVLDGPDAEPVDGPCFATI